MAKKPVKITREEFIKKILSGERDFSYIILSEGTSLKPHTQELNHYLKKQNLKLFDIRD